MAQDDAPAPRTLAELAGIAGGRLAGDGSIVIRRVGTLENAGEGAITFLANPRYLPLLAVTRASAVIVAPADEARTASARIVADAPYLAYARVAAALYPEARPRPGVHPTAIVDPTAVLGSGVTIAAHASIGAGATLGEAAIVCEGAVVGAGASIGARTRIDANVVVYDRCRLGDDVRVYAGAVIGADGFGLAPAREGWARIPQVGRVLIGNRVEVGANTTIDRGAIDDTVIEDDVKLDNQIQVGHNCVIGRGTAIAGCTGIAGSVRIGRDCRIGGAVNIAGHLAIPDGTTVGGAATVGSTIDRGGAYSGAFPLQPFADWQRTAVRLKQLDRLVDRVKALEQARRTDAATK